MATVSTPNDFALNFDTFDVDTYGYTQSTGGALGIRLSGDAANYTNFGGEGLRFTDGVPVEGTITSFRTFVNGQSVINMTGFSLEAASVYNDHFNSTGPGTYAVDTQEFVAAALTGNDQITGGTKSDVLRGFAGNDALYGRAGNDVLDGGLGRDTLRGEAGADTFDFNAAADSGIGDAGRDVVYFSQADGDKVDLSGIDTNLNVDGDQGFTHVGSYFKGNPGDFKLSGTGLFQADMNGDKVVDMEIKFSGAINVGDFFL